ncbi:MAG: adenine phosphoribosyltransferase [Planctomycetota bacterium]
MAPSASSSPPLADFLRDVPDFPKPGILFKDITPLLGDSGAFARAVRELCNGVKPFRPTHVAAIESRGFLFGAPMAEKLGAALIPLRKPGKLPWKSESETYDLEYGTNTLEIHADAAGPGDRIVLVDDLLATGGTASAAVNLLRRLGGEVVAAAFVVELSFLAGREKLHGFEIQSLIQIPA